MHKSAREAGCAVDFENREKDDFYSTDPKDVEKLLSVESFDGSIWESACGMGHISKVLVAHGIEVISTDLVDRGYGTPRTDFLMEWRPRAPNIVTNPPFKLATEFLQKSLELSTRKVALFLKLSFLEGKERKKIFLSSPLKTVYVFSGRTKCLRGNDPVTGSGMQANAWFVWDHAYKGKPTLDWI